MSDINYVAQIEIAAIEKQLKDWFLSRRVKMERHLALKKMFESNRVIGLTNSATTSDLLEPREGQMWRDLTHAKPELDEQLSINAKEMKSDLYLKMFKQSTDLDHPCRLSGTSYLTCLKKYYNTTLEDRSTHCSSSWILFESCRTELIEKEKSNLGRHLEIQQAEDNRAKNLWIRRSQLINQES